MYSTNIKVNKRLNLSYLQITDQTFSCGKYDIPYLTYEDEIFPDYICLYKDRKDYHKTDRTFVSFYEFDEVFDGKNGIYNAIYYNDVKLLSKYKDRFKDVFGFISPDYSQVADIHNIENMYRCFKSRVVANWLILECGAVVIPNISYISEKSLEYCFDGIKKNSVVAISTKGCLKKKEERDLIRKTVQETINAINPKAIVVYTVSVKNELIQDLFKEAIVKGIKIITPNNLLRERNAELLGGAL